MEELIRTYFLNVLRKHLQDYFFYFMIAVFLTSYQQFIGSPSQEICLTGNDGLIYFRHHVAYEGTSLCFIWGKVYSYSIPYHSLSSSIKQ